MKKEINFTITLNGKIQSINNMYKAGLTYKGGKPTPYIYKSAEVKKMTQSIGESLKAIDWNPHIDWLTETKHLSMTQNYIFKSNIGKRDTGNCEKAITDKIFNYIHDELGISSFNDNKIVELHLFKQILPGSEHEYICISLKPSTFNVRFDHIEVPEKILLHASDYPKGMKTSWSKEKIYLDPTKKGYNTDLFLIQDPLTPMQSSEIIQSLIKHQEQGFCIVVMSNPEQQEQVFKPFCTGGRGILITQDKLISTIQKLRNENMD